MKKSILPIIVSVLMLLLSLAACGSEQTAGAGSAEGSSLQETPVQSSDSYEPVSMNRFKKAAADLGEAQDVSEDFGFDACMVTGEDGTNYIYMYLSSDDMADQLLTDGDGDGLTDPGLQLIKSGGNYEFYKEIYENEESGATIRGYYLRVENMLILITGDQEAEETVMSDADTLFRSLGYSMN